MIVAINPRAFSANGQGGKILKKIALIPIGTENAAIEIKIGAASADSLLIYLV